MYTINNLQLTFNFFKSIVKGQLSTVANKGFTLMELLLSMGILMILISVLTTFFGQILDVQLESKAISSVDQNGRYIIARLTHDIQSMKLTDDIVLPEAAGDVSDTLQITIDSINYTYSLSNGNLQLATGSDIDNLNSEAASISNLSFTRIGNGGDNDTIRIDFTITSNTQQVKGNEQKSFQTTLGRN